MASAPAEYYSVCLHLQGRTCVVIGGGEVARRKVEALLQAGAKVTVIAPGVTSAMPDGAEIRLRDFQSSDLDGAWLVFAATNDQTVNALVASEGERRHLWVNVVDDPTLCTMIIPSVVKRGALRIAISTSGASPTLARKLRRELEINYGAEYGLLVALLWRLRRQYASNLKDSGLSSEARRHMWEQALRLPLLELLKHGEVERAYAMAEEIIRETLSASR
jgi:precorrin-2 dehydrogenase/sirohydrochlorin ferrochelatase